MAPVLTQPLSSRMNAHSIEMYNDEKSVNQCQTHLGASHQCSCAAESNPSGHHGCHQARVRRFLLPVALLFVTVGAMLAISCVTDVDVFDLIGLGAEVSGSELGKRSSSFTNNKREWISRHNHSGGN